MARRTAYLPFVRINQLKHYLDLSCEKRQDLLDRFSVTLHRKNAVLEAMLVDYGASIEMPEVIVRGSYAAFLTYALLEQECAVRELLLPVVSPDCAVRFMEDHHLSSLSGAVNKDLFELLRCFEKQNQNLVCMAAFFLPEKSCLLDVLQVFRPAIMLYNLLESQAEINSLKESFR